MLPSLPMKSKWRLAKDRTEKSEITKKRMEPCRCPRCGIKHRKSFVVPIHLPIKERRVFCKMCEYFANRDYEETYQVGAK
jgi:hypothetical protein